MWSYKYKYRDRQAVESIIIRGVPSVLQKVRLCLSMCYRVCWWICSRFSQTVYWIWIAGDGSGLKMLLLFLLVFISSRSHDIWFGNIVSLEMYSSPLSHVQMSESSWLIFMFDLESKSIFLLWATLEILIRHSFEVQISYIHVVMDSWLFFSLRKWKSGQGKLDPKKSTECSL